MLVLSIPLLFATGVFADEKDLGNPSKNPYVMNSTANPYGKDNQHGNGIGNPSGRSLYSNKSATNSFTADVPKPYDQQGQSRDRLSLSPYDLDSISNPYGRYSSQFGNTLAVC